MNQLNDVSGGISVDGTQNPFLLIPNTVTKASSLPSLIILSWGRPGKVTGHTLWHTRLQEIWMHLLLEQVQYSSSCEYT